MSTIADMEIGPAQVLFGGVDLGWTLGGITISSNDTYADIKADQHGTTVLDKVNTGTEVSVSMPFAELSHSLLATITQETMVEEGGGGSGVRTTVGTRAGCRLRENGQELILKPLDCGVPTTDQNKWYTFYIVAFEASIEETFDPESQRIWQATAHAFPDPDNDMRIFTYGDTSF